MSNNCEQITHDEMALDGLKICRFCRYELAEPDPQKLKEREDEPTINDILEQYHQKFDDSEVRELLEKLEQMMYERASFFHNKNLNLDEGSELFEKMDDYWRPFDDLGYGSSTHNEILDKLRKDVKGLGECWNCGKIGVLKSKLTKTIACEILNIIKLCENCHGSGKIIIAKHKEVVDVDTPIPDDLTHTEKDAMREFQKTYVNDQ